MISRLGNLRSVFLFDKKTMGYTFYVPIAMFAFALFLILSVPRESYEIYSNVVVIQSVFIPFSCWWLMYRLGEMYEEGAQETLIPYYTKWFLIDFLRYFALNCVAVALLCAALVVKYDTAVLSAINLAHFLLLILFYMFFGSALIILLKNMEIALTIVVIYTVLEVVTLGQYMPWVHIFLFEEPMWNPFLSRKLLILGIAVVALAVVSFSFLKKADRKPQ